MSKTSYMLEIYEPGSQDTVICSYMSDTPFPAISVGEIINYLETENEGIPDRVVRVTKITHIVWNVKIQSFKTLIYTEEVNTK